MTPPDVAGLLPTLPTSRAFAWARHSTFGGDGPPAGEVRAIVDAVRAGGDGALTELAERFDGGHPAALRVPASRCREALESLDAPRRAALELARDNVARWHEAQRREEHPIETVPGVRLWREFRPIRRVGVYVPGGRAAYPSSLLMGVVPAKIAGCEEVVVCSPAGPGGEPAASVLAAAALAEVDELYAVGGAHAVAALAFGTESIRPVDKIFGPGGAWVNAAKLAVFDTVAIDLPAGPSEVVVWADGSSDADRIAAELVAQAEHGPDSRCGLALHGDRPDDLATLAAEVRVRLFERIDALPTERREAATESLAGGAAFIARTAGDAARWIDEIAPEHLAILAAKPRERLAQVSSAGAVFLGASSPVA
ncbi:MAG: histidinol dehydrogenase, partial [Gemmatimonadota bacterium]